ncbi:unnamed protein product [Urochloa humidicola]
MLGDDSPSTAAGTVLLGRYELGDLLGRGASAKVYLARDLVTGQHQLRSVAIKLVANLRRLRHRHVVQLHEILATRKKVHFVLDLAAGGELFSLLDSLARTYLTRTSASLLLMQVFWKQQVWEFCNIFRSGNSKPFTRWRTTSLLKLFCKMETVSRNLLSSINSFFSDCKLEKNSFSPSL